jgi:hypothetical protein
VEAVLESLRPASDSFVSGSGGVQFWPGDTTACTSGAANPITITFNKALGNAPQISVAKGSLASSIGGIVLVSSTTITTGTTENVECSGRGLCNKATGECTCATGFTTSDGNNGPGSIADCGYKSGVISTCPIANTKLCNGKGECSGTTLYQCTCYAGYAGAACERKLCPKGRAWFDEATAANTAHGLAECSNRGVCDYGTGTCACQSGFEGLACDRLQCTGAEVERPCNKRGQCLSLRDAAKVSTESGVARGDIEVQTLTCTVAPDATSYTFSRFSGLTPSTALTRSSTVADLIAALAVLGYGSNGVPVTVTGQRNAGGALCLGAGTTVVTKIAFTHSQGDVPLLSLSPVAAGVFYMSEQQKGSRLAYGVDDKVAWDADMIRGCHCDGRPNGNLTDPIVGDRGRHYGLRCEHHACPVGPDPRGSPPTGTSFQKETQTFSCEATSGSFTLTFRGQTTAAIAYNAKAKEVKAALEALSTIGRVSVSFSSSQLTVCGLFTPVQTTVTFETELGDVPTMELTDSTGPTSLAGALMLVNDVQTVTCTATEGTFVLVHGSDSTVSIDAATATAATLVSALTSLTSIGAGVSATISSGTLLCSADAPTTTITFPGSGTTLKLRVVDSTTDAPNVFLGFGGDSNYILRECSTRGTCNVLNGKCSCYTGYRSGDGYMAVGGRGDCGALDIRN